MHTYRRDEAPSKLDCDTLALQISLQVRHELQLLVHGEPTDDHLEDRSHCDMVFADETAVIHICEDAHEESETAGQ